tara:strand:- start:270 stop:518 length:249 start_codon:yes stop_codon:yes gene_type:complete
MPKRINADVFFKSETGMKIISIIMGLGIAGLFKMSCDSRSCIVYKGPDMSKKKQIKYNDKCYKSTEVISQCRNNDEKEKIYL